MGQPCAMANTEYNYSTIRLHLHNKKVHKFHEAIQNAEKDGWEVVKLDTEIQNVVISYYIAHLRRPKALGDIPKKSSFMKRLLK